MYHLSGGNNRIELVTNVFLNTDSDLQEATNWKEKIISLLQKVPSKADSLKPVIQFLVATLEPSKIYMLQHSGINEAIPDRYFDLLIVMPSSTPPFTEFEPVLDIAYLKNKRVCCSLHNDGNVIEKLKIGHPFYALAFTQENILYDNSSTAYPVATSEQSSLIRQTVIETFLKGFGKAKTFYYCAEKEFSEGSNEIALFMLHQAVELTCRSITLSLNGYEEKVHEIRIHKKHIPRSTPELLSIFNEENENDKKLLDILEKGYKDARYNYEFKVEENILPPLFEKVELFQNTALKIVKRITGEELF
jgi:HEPN domain-containing protein